jgi:hypothetical protein
MSFITKEQKRNHVYIGQGYFDELEIPPPVDHIKTSILDRLVFISYANYCEQKDKITKLKSSLILIFNSDTGVYEKQAMLPQISIINIGVVESKKLLILMARGDNSLLIIDYTDCKGLAKIERLPSSQMFVFPFSSDTIEMQIKLYNQAIDADALIYLGMDNGDICTGLLKAGKDKENRLLCTWVPQNLYSTQKFVKNKNEFHLRILHSIWYNIVLDKVAVSDANGIVYIIDKTFYYTLK